MICDVIYLTVKVKGKLTGRFKRSESVTELFHEERPFFPVIATVPPTKAQQGTRLILALLAIHRGSSRI